MNRAIVKAAVTTVLALIVAGLVAIAVLNYGFPQHMATACERLGSYGEAAKYASRRYEKTGDLNDLVRVVEDSIYADRSDFIIEYGEELIASESFGEICAERDEDYKNTGYGVYTASYKQYISGNVAAAYYAVGETDKAVELAFGANGSDSFANHNALMSLSILVADSGDREAAQKIVAKLAEISPATEEEQTYLDDMVAILSEI